MTRRFATVALPRTKQAAAKSAVGSDTKRGAKLGASKGKPRAGSAKPDGGKPAVQQEPVAPSGALSQQLAALKVSNQSDDAAAAAVDESDAKSTSSRLTRPPPLSLEDTAATEALNEFKVGTVDCSCGGSFNLARALLRRHMPCWPLCF